MAGMLSNSDIEKFTEDYGKFFETFQKDIVVYKQAKQTAVVSASPSLFGYDNSSNVTNFTNVIVSGVFKGVLSSSDNAEKDGYINEVNLNYKNSSYLLKVEEDVKNFINNGYTEKIVIDNKSFSVIGSDKKINFFSKSYYNYELKELA